MLLVPVFCGIDWAEDHYDLALVDQAGVVLTERRINDDSNGYQLLLALLAEHGDDQVEPIPVAIETPRGLVVACLRRTGRQVYAINPLSVARYRERHSVARTKSDRIDAQLLANILRTDRAAHRPLPADSELAQAVAVLARAQQDAVWNRQQVANQLRSLLREYYPAFVSGSLPRPRARWFGASGCLRCSGDRADSNSSRPPDSATVAGCAAASRPTAWNHSRQRSASGHLPPHLAASAATG